MRYIVLKEFTDKYDKSVKYESGKIYEFTKKRAKEILKVDKLIEEVQEEQ